MQVLKSKRSWVLAFLILIALFGGALSLRSDWPRSAPVPILRFAYNRFPGSLPGLLAQKLGYFENGSCAVELIEDGEHMQTNSRFAAGLYSGMATTMGTAVASSPVMPEQRIVYIKDDSRGADVLLADSTMERLEDLKGKTLGVVVGDFSEFWLESILSQVGLRLQDVKLLPVKGSLVPEAISRHTIRAGHSWPPDAQRGLRAGQKILASSADDAFVIADVLLFRRDAIARHRACVREFLGAWSRAVHYWRDHPEAASRILAGALQVEDAAISQNGLKIFDLADNHELLPSPRIRRLIESYASFFQRRGTTIPENLIEQLLDPSLVNELVEEAP